MIWNAVVVSGRYGKVSVTAFVDGRHACRWDLGRRRHAVHRLMRAIVAGCACIWDGTSYRPTVSVETLEQDLRQLGF